MKCCRQKLPMIKIVQLTKAENKPILHVLSLCSVALIRSPETLVTLPLTGHGPYDPLSHECCHALKVRAIASQAKASPFVKYIVDLHPAAWRTIEVTHAITFSAESEKVRFADATPRISRLCSCTNHLRYITIL